MSFWDDAKPPADGLLNVEAVITLDVIWWVGDRADIDAMTAAGFGQTVALAGTVDDALKQHADDLKTLKQIVLCLPSTTAGMKLREVLAGRLGRHCCWTVAWPSDSPSAHATAIAMGSDRLAAVMHAATPYPIAGMQRIRPGTLALLRVQPAPAVMTTGTLASDKILHLPVEGRLIVVTGWPGAGKSNWTRFVMIHTAKDHGRRWAVFSPEMQPWEQFVAECAEVYHGKPFWPKYKIAGMSDADVTEAERFLADRVVMLVSDAEDKAPTLDWLFDLARVAVLRDGVTDLLIDPWNEVDHQRGEMSETDYIGRSLQRLKSFALRHSCNVWIVAHPAKPLPLRNGEKRGAPGPYDISGSSHWANKTDLGITVHSPVAGKAEIHLWKTRFRRWGRRGDVVKLDFDELCGVYGTPIETDPAPAPSTWDTAGENSYDRQRNKENPFMIEAYKVGVSLLMGQGIGDQLNSVIAQFQQIDALVKSINGATKGMGNFTGVASAAEKVSKAAADAARSMPDVARAAEATAAAMERTASAAQQLRIAGPPPMLALPAGRPINLPPMPALPAPPGTGFTMGPRADQLRLTGDPYMIGANGFPSGWTPPPGTPQPGPGPRALMNVPQPAGNPNFTIPGQYAGFGFANQPGVGAGGGGLGNLMPSLYQIDMGVHMVERFMDLLNSAIDKAVQINTEMVRLELGGVNKASREALRSTANDVARDVGARTVPRILEDAISMRAIMGDEVGADPTAAVRLLMPTAEKAALLLKAATGEDSPEAMARLYKTVELRGDVIDPVTKQISAQRFATGIDAVLDLLILGHGQIKTSDLYNLVKQAGSAIRTPEDPYAAWASVMTPTTELGGSRTGTGLTAAFRALIGGSMSMRFAKEMIDLGLTTPGAKYDYQLPAMKGLRAPVFFKGKDWLLDEDVLMKQGLKAWIDDVAKKHMAEHGITSTEEIGKEIYRLQNTETYRRLASIYMTQGAQVARDILMYKNVPGFDEKFNILKNKSAEFASQALRAAFFNSVAAMTEPFLPAWMASQRYMTGVFNDITDQSRHPSPIVNLLYGNPFHPIDRIAPLWSNPLHWFNFGEERSSAIPPAGGSAQVTLAPGQQMHVIVDNGRDLTVGVARGITNAADVPSNVPTGGAMQWNLTPQPGHIDGFP